MCLRIVHTDNWYRIEFLCVPAHSTCAHKHEAHYCTWIVISLSRDKVELINWSHPLGSNDVFVFLNLSKSQGCGSFHIALAIIYLQRAFKPIYNVLFAPQQKLLICHMWCCFSCCNCYNSTTSLPHHVDQVDHVDHSHQVAHIGEVKQVVSLWLNWQTVPRLLEARGCHHLTHTLARAHNLYF